MLWLVPVKSANLSLEGRNRCMQEDPVRGKWGTVSPRIESSGVSCWVFVQNLLLQLDGPSLSGFPASLLNWPWLRQHEVPELAGHGLRQPWKAIPGEVERRTQARKCPLQNKKKGDICISQIGFASTEDFFFPQMWNILQKGRWLFELAVC